jgi:hypothetical protein
LASHRSSGPPSGDIPRFFGSQLLAEIATTVASSASSIRVSESIVWDVLIENAGGSGEDTVDESVQFKMSA